MAVASKVLGPGRMRLVVTSCSRLMAQQFFVPPPPQPGPSGGILLENPGCHPSAFRWRHGWLTLYRSVDLLPGKGDGAPVGPPNDIVSAARVGGIALYPS